MKKIILAAAAIAALGITMSASASTISYKVYDSLTGTFTSNEYTGATSSSSGVLVGSSASDAYFTVGVNATGYSSQAPNFTSNSFTVSTNQNSLPGAATLMIFVTNMDMTSGPSSVMNTLSVNALANPGGGFSGANLVNYFDPSDGKYGMGQTLASANFTGVGGFVGPVYSTITPSGLYSETMVYTLNFSAATQQGTQVSANDQIIGVTPEPSSLALLGTGLMGVAGIVRRRLKS